MRYYTVYKDDEIIAFGSSSQCTKKLGFKSIRSFYSLISRSRTGIRDHYAFVIEIVNDIEYFDFLLDMDNIQSGAFAYESRRNTMSAL